MYNIKELIDISEKSNRWLHNSASNFTFHPSEIAKMVQDNPAQETVLSQMEWVMVDPLNKYKNMLAERDDLNKRIETFKTKLCTYRGYANKDIVESGTANYLGDSQVVGIPSTDVQQGDKIG